MRTQKTNRTQEMQKLHETCMLCIASLEQKGYSNQEAEKMILDTLKDSAEYLKNGMVYFAIKAMKMIYLDEQL
jgi:hypothetical protein